jgi:hypothetical protein
MRGDGPGARDWIETAPAEWIATQQTPKGERGAVKHSVMAYGKYCIFRACGLKAAGAGKSTHRMHERRNPSLV